MMNRIKTLQELNLLDRFLFSEVMADTEILEEVLEIPLSPQERQYLQDSARQLKQAVSSVGL